MVRDGLVVYRARARARGRDATAGVLPNTGLASPLTLLPDRSWLGYEALGKVQDIEIPRNKVKNGYADSESERDAPCQTKTRFPTWAFSGFHRLSTFTVITD